MAVISLGFILEHGHISGQLHAVAELVEVDIETGHDLGLDIIVDIRIGIIGRIPHSYFELLRNDHEAALAVQTARFGFHALSFLRPIVIFTDQVEAAETVSRASDIPAVRGNGLVFIFGLIC